VQKQWVLNKKREDLPRSRHFDGIPVDGAAERADIPRMFAVCNDCRAREATAAETGGTSALPRQVTLVDLDEAPCEPTGEVLPDKARRCAMPWPAS
jgi:hypothetical protein